jgi:hypothetical protein
VEASVLSENRGRTTRDGNFDEAAILVTGSISSNFFFLDLYDA